MNVQYIHYKHGLIKKISDRKKLTKHQFVDRDISDELSTLIEENGLLDLSGSFGLKDGANPIEYDELRIRADNRVCELEIYNKGMSMMFAETPELKRIFQVCCKLQDMART